MKRAFTCGVALAALSLASLAHANSRLPEANQLVVAPDDPASMLLRTTFGFLFTHDAGMTWDWLCEDAIPVSGQQDPAVALMNGGVVLSAQQEGLAVSPDRGCSWSFASGTAKELAVDVARAPDGANAIAVTNVFQTTNDAGTLLYTSQMLHTSDTGKSWQPLAGAIDSTLSIDTIDLAPSDPQRIYLTGQPFGASQGTILVSKDGGASYQPFPIPFVEKETGAYICGIDPTNADRIYMRTLGTSSTGQFSRLLVSSNGGQTFSAAWTGDKMLGFALSKDGTRVYVGSAADGLLAANASDLVFTQKASLQVQCLTTSGDTLYVCGSEANAHAQTGKAFIIGATKDEGTTFAPLLTLETIHEPIVCPAGTSASKCESEWPALVQQLGIQTGTTNDAGTDGGTTGGCGCDTAGPSAFEALLLAPLALLLFRLRSRLFRAAR